MKDIFTERQALKDHIEWIREERRKLSDEYWRAIERLKELDEKAINEVQQSPELINKLLEGIEKQNKTVAELKTLIPSVPVEKVISQWEDESKVKTIDIEKEKDKDEQYAPTKRTSRQDRKKMTKEVASYLKEKGYPLKTNMIKEFLESKGYKINNMTMVMNSIMEYEPKIERASRGYYQHRG